MRHANRISNVISVLVVVLLLLLVWQSLVLRQAATQTVLLGVLAGLMATIVMQSVRYSDNLVQYKMVAVGSVDEPALQKFGEEGWRLICADATGTHYIFTR